MLAAGLLTVAVLAQSGPLSAVAAHRSSTHQAKLIERVTAAAVAQESSLVALRHDLHRHPELSGAETRTARLVAERLRALGFEVRTGVGGHGVVAVLRGGRPGPLVAFRADMDAVASNAPDPVAYRSLTPGVRHICGHDVHTAIGIGLAASFAAVRDELPGSVMLVFQPAEENASGAKAMLADDVFGSERPVAIYAVHTAPYDVGTLATRAGGLMAGRSHVTVSISGQGATPAIADEVRAAIRGVGTVDPARAFERPPDGFILAQVFGGAAGARGTTQVGAQVATADAAARTRARTAILDRLRALERIGVSLDVRYDDLAIAGVTNDSALVARADRSIRGVLGDAAVVRTEGAPPAFSEDFGSFQAEAPGVMYFLGVSNPAEGTVGMPHTDAYVADDAAILVGVRAMAAVLLDRLEAGDSPH